MTTKLIDDRYEEDDGPKTDESPSSYSLSSLSSSTLSLPQLQTPTPPPETSESIENIGNHRRHSQIISKNNKISNDITSIWKQNISIFVYFIIFSSGALISCVVFIYFQSQQYQQHQQYPFNMKQINEFHQPGEHYLQVRDEYNLLSQYGDQSHGGEYSEVRKPLKSKKSKVNIQEALSTLKVANELRTLGKDDKALRLFKHAMALAPKHPDVLTNYGEYLEHNRRDIVTADLLYFQALTVNPEHSIAAENRRRTSTIVEIFDQKRLEEIDAKRDAISAIHESNAALRRAKKEAYFQNVYHSVGIEGNTMTLAQTRSILETRMAVDGKSIDEHNEILGLDAAMKYINATLVNRNDYITMADILEIHKRVLGHVDPVEGGEFRRTQVYVGGHIPPGPGDLLILMNRFEQWLNSPQALSMHPVKYAALAHYKLVHIHPFTDGNGRTSRLLMNTILMRSGFPPVIIPKQQRHKYYDFLQFANEGDIRPFVRFIADCTDKTLDLFLWATSELSHQIPLLAQNDEEGIIGGNGDGQNNGFDDGSGDTIRLNGDINHDYLLYSN